MGYNIVSKCGKDSLMFQNPFFLQGLFIHPSYTRKEWLVVFNDILISKIIRQIKTWDFILIMGCVTT
jgi:hypothetical protein